MERREPEQLNTADAPEEYQLEDIMREFGADSEEPKMKTSSDTVVFRPIRSAPLEPDLNAPTKSAEPKLRKAPQEAARKAQPEPSERTEERLQEKLKEKPKEKPKKAASKASKPAENPPRREKPPKPPKAPKMRVEAPPTPPETPQELLRACKDGAGIQRVRLLLLALVAAAQLFLMLYAEFAWSFLPLTGKTVGWLSLALAVLSLLLACDVLLVGARGLAHLRVGLDTLALPVSLLTLLHAVQTVPQGGQTYCPVLSLLLLFLLRARTAKRSAGFHTLRTVCGFDSPMGIFDAPQLLEDADSLRRDTGDEADFLRCLRQPDRPQTVWRVYTLLLLPLSGAAAYLLARRGGSGFVQAWLLLLLGGIPFAGALCFQKPFSVLAKRLASFGGALCGWHGAKIFGGKHTIILRDEDIFPRANISSNGMKLFGAHKAGRVIAYALAALEAADSPLTDLFETLLRTQYGKRCHASNFRVYDNNGIGAEVMGEVVLVGTLGFVRSMGVHMPEGTRVRQAVYVSVGGELAGIFAIKYKASPSTKTGLRDVLANRNFSVVLATRDFLITPELIAAKYELSTQTLSFPSFTERLRLSDIDPSGKAEQGALIAKDTFGAFASTVAAGRTLRSTSLLSLGLCLFAGVLGAMLSMLLLVWEAPASPMHLAAFQLVWACLNSFFTFVLLHF